MEQGGVIGVAVGRNLCVSLIGLGIQFAFFQNVCRQEPRQRIFGGAVCGKRGKQNGKVGVAAVLLQQQGNAEQGVGQAGFRTFENRGYSRIGLFDVVDNGFHHQVVFVQRQTGGAQGLVRFAAAQVKVGDNLQGENRQLHVADVHQCGIVRFGRLVVAEIIVDCAGVEKVKRPESRAGGQRRQGFHGFFAVVQAGVAPGGNQRVEEGVGNRVVGTGNGVDRFLIFSVFGQVDGFNGVNERAFVAFFPGHLRVADSFVDASLRGEHDVKLARQHLFVGNVGDGVFVIVRRLV